MTIAERVTVLEKDRDTILDILNRHTEALNAINVRLQTVESKVDGLSVRFQRIEGEIGDIKPLLLQVIKDKG